MLYRKADGVAVSRSRDISGCLSLWSCEMGIAISPLAFPGVGMESYDLVGTKTFGK